MSGCNYLSLKKLKKLGVETHGKEIYVERGCRIESGVKLYSPCHISGETHLCGGVTLYPYCQIDRSFLGRGTVVRASHICDSTVGENCTVGPYAYLRQGAKIGAECRVGDFVEIKNSTLGAGCKAAHLSYIGDASLGGRVNVGCGVVFANYDGQKKSRSAVGDGCFIGCNCNIVAPVTIGCGAYIAAGTTVCGDVAEGELVIGRCRERRIPQGAEGRYRHG